MLQDLFGRPAAADIMPNDRVKEIAAICSGRSSATDYLLDLIQAVAAPTAVEAVTGRRLQ